MSFTAGLLLVFLNIFLPGLIFLRAYFVGEFSKQFNTRVPIIRLAFYSLVPGLLFFLSSIYFYSLCDKNFSVSGALEIYLNLLSADGGFKDQTSHFLNNDLGWFILFISCTYLIAGLLGVTLHYIIRKFNFDKKRKILRFKNYWYYIFSGEIVKFPKFERAMTDIQIGGVDRDSDVLMTYADILVNECGKSRMFTGYVLDYELEQDNINALDKIYLLDAHKYDYVPSPQFRYSSNYVKKSIPGQLFVIDYKNIQNLNITYVPSFNWMLHKLEKRDKRLGHLDTFFAVIFFVILFLSISFVWFNWPIDLFSAWNLNVWLKIVLNIIVLFPINTLLFVIQLLGENRSLKSLRKIRNKLLVECEGNVFSNESRRNDYFNVQAKILDNLKEIKSSKKLVEVFIASTIIYSLIFILTK